MVEKQLSQIRRCLNGKYSLWIRFAVYTLDDKMDIKWIITIIKKKILNLINNKIKKMNFIFIIIYFFNFFLLSLQLSILPFKIYIIDS